MILIYEATETAFSSFGLGALAPISCTVTEEINGQYELAMDHPIDDGGKWEKIENDRIIKAPTSDGDQLFRIYSNVKNPITGRLNVNARHIFYDLLDNLLEDTRPTAKTGQEAGETILEGCQYETPFSFSSDITAVSTAYYIRVNPVQAMIGSIDQSFINRWGGEIRRNNFAISINARRGSDKGVRVAYGKNLTGIDVTEDISSLYTRIMPTALDADNVVFYTDAKYYDSPLIGNYAHPRISILDTGIRVGQTVDGAIPYPDEATAKTAMAAMAEAAFGAGADKPKLTINVSFIRWQDTDQYAAYKDLYTLELGDDVTVDYSPLNLTYNLRVISITWDAILNKVISMTLGDKAPNLAQNVVDIDIDLAALRNNVVGALMEGESYNDVRINHSEGFVASATIDGVLIEVKHNATEGFAIYADDVYVGGVTVVDGAAAVVSSMLTNDIDGDVYSVIGTDGIYKGIFVYNKATSTTVPVLKIMTFGNNLYMVDGNGNVIQTTSGSIICTTSGGVNTLTLSAASAFLQCGTVNAGRVYSTSTDIYLQLGTKYIGVDSTGPYYNKSGTKVYF